jgi:hypothetical protein
MDKKIKVLALISIVIAATVAASIILVEQSTAKADTNGTVGSDVQPTLSSVNTTNTGNFSINGFMGFRGFGDHRCMGMGRGFGGSQGFGGQGGFGSIQVSSDFTQNVTNIAQNDSDVQNLLNQGYNITSVTPVISTVIDGSGNIATKATTANLTLQSTTGRAFVVVDLSQAKVIKIVTLTRTEIDK